ncbi:hypothetical protein E6O75_ATG04848 [Venturia nashicola]|uniref:Uncharacterized protein n=1 Tax=Venturia nashicola TaxID=86259 RepID=A0A4Z1P223_9PEZI|nr:hypothetical protein E6O75_ATG04848 [Venturia nashicola]
MFRGINRKSKEYLKGCVSGILKTFIARWKTSHEGQDYQNSLTHLFAEKITVSSEISDRTNQTPYCFPEIHHCRIQQSSDLFFIPTAVGSEYRKYSSSTEIRKVMEKNTGHRKEITEELASIVLGPQRKVSLE